MIHHPQTESIHSFIHQSYVELSKQTVVGFVDNIQYVKDAESVLKLFWFFMR